ncbi:MULTISPECIES: NAD(P)/FAD-dependent oxidoreductase [unclassified Streptomyces]|uniref:FAD-dependent oxidoreductase n=1 Tax=unclassified Streptomyces TaxID=2593676 RepID=UPI00278BF566|nr:MULTISPECIES: FAD-dependent monooxygenase [unclassified Streptomyces]
MRNRQQQGPRIAIVGGGIGGMAAAAYLHRAGLTVTVHEQAAALTEVGAGLVLAPNAVRPLRALGVADAALARAVPLDLGWEFRRWQDGTVLSVERLDGVCERLYGERMYTAHRAHLLDALRSAVPDGAVRLGARCTRVEPRADGVRLTFADGSRTDADLVIGADGMHSLVRAAVAAPQQPRFSGLCAFRTVVPAAAAPAFALRRAQTLWLGPGHHFVHYPISGGDAVNVVAYAPATRATEESWSATATVEEFHAEFSDWDDRVTSLIKAGSLPGRWALYDRPPLPSWTRGRMTLLGDAAHPMFPFYGQGAAQAMEDAAVLARCLSATPEAPAEALSRYETERLPRATRLQRASHARAESNHLPDGPEQRRRDAALGDADPLADSGWIYGYDAGAVVIQLG